MNKKGTFIWICTLSVLFLIECTVAYPFGEPDWYLYMEKACQFCQQGEFAQAKEYLQKGHAEAKKYGGNPPLYQPSPAGPHSTRSFPGELATLADCYQGVHNYDRAEVLFKEAIALSPKTSYETSLAMMYQRQGKYNEAEELYIDVLKRYESNQADDENTETGKSKGTKNSFDPMRKIFNPQTTHLLEQDYILKQLAECYAQQNKFPEAEKLYIKDLDLMSVTEKSLGHSASLRVIPLMKLGELYLKEAKLDEAKKQFEEARLLQESRKTRPDNYWHCLSCLADVYAAQGQEKEAETLYKEALDGYDSLQTPKAQEITTCEHYAKLLRQTKRPSEADAMIAKANSQQSKLLELKKKGKRLQMHYQ